MVMLSFSLVSRRLDNSRESEFVRYIIASAVALGLDTVFLFTLTSGLGINYLVSGALSFSAGLVFIYLASVTWVFDSRRLENRSGEFAIFALIGIIGLVINEVLLWLFTDIIGLFYLVSKALTISIVFGWNFSARKRILFPEYE